MTAIRKEAVFQTINLLPKNLQEDMVTFGEQLRLEGEAKGKAEGKTTLVCNMKTKKNMPISDIAEIAELTTEEVIDILTKNGLI